MKIIKTILFLFLATTVFSQNYATKNLENPYIEVIGKAEKEIVPDEIYMNICIRERIENGKKLTIEFLENKLKTELENIGIPIQNLSISDLNAVLSKTGWWTKEVFSIANYTLKINGAGKLKNLFEKFESLKISDVNVTKATHSKMVSFRKENRINAIKAAKEKATYLLKAIGEKTGKPIIINEITNNNQQQYATANYINSSSSYASIKKIGRSKKGIVQFEKIKISTSIYVKFQIK
jgi:uncharacterized protein YggE